MNLTMEQVAGAIDAAPRSRPSSKVAGYSIDSRTIGAGELFFAIRAERDGHEFVADALSKGAAAAVVAADWTGNIDERRLLRVDDPQAALGRLGNFARRRWGGRVLAVTGSNGKTTTKEICAACLSVGFKTAKTVGNLNNELGVPLTLLRMDETAEVAVVEMGMNHAGEIRRLARIAEPNAGVVTNVSFAHVGAFDSVEGVAAAKRELIEELSSEGTAILNADDARVAGFTAAHQGPSVTFGVSNDADFRARDLRAETSGGQSFELTRKGQPGFRISTRLAGRHNVSNVLAGVAASSVFGISAERLIAAIAEIEAGARRGRTLRRGGVEVIDDCYNANPAAMEAMLAELASRKADRRVAVLGEMRELGAFSEDLHRKVGAAVLRLGVDLLVAVGGDARFIVEEATARGLAPANALFFVEAPAAGAALRDLLTAGDVVLFKGSRGVALERALERALPAEAEPQPGESQAALAGRKG